MFVNVEANEMVRNGLAPETYGMRAPTALTRL
jgi:hypothetical protein